MHLNPAWRLPVLLVTCLMSVPQSAAATEVTADQHALHERLLVLDSHLDTPSNFGRPGWRIDQRHSFRNDLTQVDLPRMAEGGLDGGFWVIYTPQGPLTPEGYAAARDAALLRAMNIRQTVAANAGQMELAYTAADAARIAAAGRRIVYQSIENAYPLGEDLSLLATFHALGVRMAGQVHGRNNQFADSATEIPRWQGLSPLGREWVHEMNRLGMVIDGSHASDAAFDQLLELSEAPIVLSHSGPKAIFDHPRNLDDARIRRLAEKGGVIQVNSLFLVVPSQDPGLRAIVDRMMQFEKLSPAEQQQLIADAAALPSFERSPGADFELFMKSLLHLIEVAGVDHVGIGADWDGGGGVAGMEDITALPKITAALLQAGYGEDDIARIWSGNLLRVMSEVEDLARRKAQPAPARTIAVNDADLRTTAEKTGFRRTGRYVEVERLCRAYAARWPGQVRCFEFGRTPQGRPMLALAASADGLLSPEATRAAARPVLLFQGGIHAGEIDGKDAGFLALRELLSGKVLPQALGKVTWLFVPVFNVDGHERFGPWNRPNQRGPEEMGWRTTAQRLNLNRDYMKAEAPEMQAMIRLLRDWDPIVYADLHVTNGAKFRHDVAIEVEPASGWDAELAGLGREIQAVVLARLVGEGFWPLDFYPSLVVGDDPASGFAKTVYTPRFASGYWPGRNRFAVLVETHSWKEYPRRVAATRATVLALTALASEHAMRWRQAALDADARDAIAAGQPFELSWRSSAASRMIDFEGYAYERVASEVSGGIWVRYDESRPLTWRVPLRDQVEPAVTAIAPGAGYLVPAEYAGMLGPRLALHGIAFERLAGPLSAVPVQAFRADSVTPARTALEGRFLSTFTGSWVAGQRDLVAGALYVPVAQPAARLLMGLLEPQAPDSYAAWGLFANSFERKEYMEAYVAEEVAREMLVADAGLREEFEARLASDAAFAASPALRRQFFERRHPSWDGEFNLYPVLRLEAPPMAGRD